MLTRKKLNKILNFIIFSSIFFLLCFYSASDEDQEASKKNLISAKFMKFSKLLSIKNYERNKRLEAEIAKDLEKIVPGLGNFGAAVKLVGNSFERGELDYASNGLNVEASNHISYNRTIRDNRHRLCKNMSYDLKALPKASVIIIFHNEVYSVLLRTVHSVLNKSPGTVLKDVILVDDFSSNEDLKDKLEYYIENKLPDKVKLIRLPER